MFSQTSSRLLAQIQQRSLVFWTFSACCPKKSRMDEKSLSQYVRSNRNPPSKPGASLRYRHMI
jgi:hypothetical protein